MARTYATRNPSDKSSLITLSWWDLTWTFTWSNWNWESMRGTIWVSTGKWYREYKATTMNSSKLMIFGIWRSTSDLTIYTGYDAYSWSLYVEANNSANTRKVNNNSFAVYGTNVDVNDVVWVALDCDTGVITFYKNNTTMWSAYTGQSFWTVYPMMSFVSNGDVVVANFWATTMAYTAPSGYNQWLYTDTIDFIPQIIML